MSNAAVHTKRCSSCTPSAAASHQLVPTQPRASPRPAPPLPTHLQNRSAEWAHLGLVGPTLRAEVGDVIKVTLKNLVPGKSVSLHPHGVLYTKAGEGSPYNDGTAAADKLDDAVEPSECALQC